MTRTLSATLTAVVLLAACGGERRADTATQSADSAVTGASPAAPSDSAPQAAPTPSASADSAAQPAKPADTAAKSATAAKPAPKKTATAAPAPKKAAAPAPSAAAPAPRDTSSSEQADQPLRDAYHQAPKDTVDQATYDGWKQFNLNCARCHGEDVLGTTIAPHLILSLKPDGPINTKELFMQTVCAGRPAKGMPAWCALGLDMNTINDIYLYVKGRSDAKISPGRPAVKAAG
ncbi:MAG TPA: c-type cytochrome [Gemmatimonadales bacterium]|nr:c-type cytochrome [Gemmatimonadales bacterium]